MRLGTDEQVLKPHHFEPQASAKHGFEPHASAKHFEAPTIAQRSASGNSLGKRSGITLGRGSSGKSESFYSKTAPSSSQRSIWRRGSGVPGSAADCGSRDLDLNRKAQERQKLRLQKLKSEQLAQREFITRHLSGDQDAQKHPPPASAEHAALLNSLANASARSIDQQHRSQTGGSISASGDNGGAGFPAGVFKGPAGSPRTAATRSSAAAGRVGGASTTALSGVSDASTNSNLPQTAALEAARARSGELQPSSFSSPSEVAEVEAGNSRFNEMQERQMTAGSPLGSLNGLGSSPALAATSPMADTAEELQQPSLSPFNDAAQLRQPSSDASDDGLCDLEGARTWCSFRRARVADARRGSNVERQDLACMSLDTRRAASIALERKAIAAERLMHQKKQKRGVPTHSHTQQQRIEEVELDPEAGGIWVEREWKAAEGVRLTDDLVLGKILGSGFQAHVFELLDNDGNLAPIVLKASRSRALISDTQREWATGQRLAALGPGDAPLPGIMKTGPAVCRVRKRADKKGSKLMGMILERINGKSVSKVIAEPDFCDVRYIREMLFSIFTALDAAQRAFGFHHYDLRLDNVMEHTPDPAQSAQDPISLSLVGDIEDRVQERTFKMIDFGLAKFDEMYAADEGADYGADMVGEDSSKKAPWYLAPLTCLGSAPEAVHQAAWRGKGDVYHLLFDLSMALHGRVWPERDRPAVKRLMSLIRHVTGTVPGAAFAKHPEDLTQGGTCMPVQCFGVPSDRRRGGAAGLYDLVMQRSFATKWLRKLKAWQFPTNPGLTASEVLTSPFFR